MPKLEFDISEMVRAGFTPVGIAIFAIVVVAIIKSKDIGSLIDIIMKGQLAEKQFDHKRNMDWVKLSNANRERAERRDAREKGESSKRGGARKGAPKPPDGR